MARSPTKPSQRADLNSFVQGLITEASPLNFPPNASVDEENFELNRDGTRNRRRGMDYESGFLNRSTFLPTADFVSSYGTSTYVWSGVNGDSSKEYLVCQIRNVLFFYDTQVETLSSTGFINTVTISEFPTNVKFSYASVDGYLVVVAGVDVIAVLTNYSGNLFNKTLKRIKVRDVWGIEIKNAGVDNAYETEDDYRGSPNTPETQIYNLQNQSWGIPRRSFTVPEFDPFGTYAVLLDPIDFFKNYNGNKHPANSETVFSGLQFQAGTSKDNPSERMYYNLYDDVRGLGQKAAKGYFIIDLLRRGSTRVEQSQLNRTKYPIITHSLSSTVSDYTTGGARIARAFAGRVFYAGFDGVVVDGDARSPSLNNTIVFSQLVKSIADIDKCYQEGDPTSREGADIIDTDGGFVKIAGAESIVGLRALGNSLIVFATNGVWELLGGSDYGFSATNYKVNKLSSIGAFSESAIVEEIGKLFFWGQDGIYVVGPDQFQSTTVKSITESTIQTLYNNIPSEAKSKAAGVYDIFSKKIRWIYNTGVQFTSTSESRELIFDTILGAFYENKIANILNNVEVVGSFVSAPFNINTEVNLVVAGPDDVIAGADTVSINQAVRISKLQSIKYVVYTNIAGTLYMTIALYRDNEFIDWRSYNSIGVDAKAYLMTGARTAGDSAVDKQIPYIIMHFRRTETGVDAEGNFFNPSGCLMRSQWDFANTPASMKYSPLVQVYRYNLPKLIFSPTYDTGFEVITTKNKLRGRGKAFSMYLETEPKKDCQILGWNITLNGNSVT